MGERILDWLGRILRILLVVFGLAFIIGFVVIAVCRIGYPFELEWMEGGTVDHVRRIIDGQLLYVSPSLEFIPFIYPPLYFYLGALLSRLLGIGFAPLRLISFLSSLGCFTLIFFMVRRETKNNYAGILAACFMAATFRLAGAWFDIARVDSLFLLFLLAGLYTVRFHRSYLWTGLFLTLAFLTKQTALSIIPFVLLYYLLFDPRRAIRFIVLIALLIGGGSLLLDVLHKGWFSYYIFGLPGHFSIERGLTLRFLGADLLAPLPIASVFLLFFFCRQVINRDRRFALFYLLMAAGLLGSTWLMRANHGCYDNVLMPAYALISIIFGLTVHACSEIFAAVEPTGKRLAGILVSLLGVVQFVFMMYDPFAQIPNSRDRLAGTQFIQTISQIPGDILVPFHGYLPQLGGKRCHAHAMAIQDVLRAGDPESRSRLVEEIKEAIRQRRFSAIILDNYWFRDEIERYYQVQSRVFDDPDRFWPVTGMMTRPEFIYTPQDE